MKKIQLSKETIRTLDEIKLENVLGGGWKTMYSDTSCKPACWQNTNCWVGCRQVPE